jgi:hypothetical protein
VTGEDPKAKDAARNKLLGRALVIALGLLIAAYVIVTFRR